MPRAMTRFKPTFDPSRWWTRVLPAVAVLAMLLATAAAPAAAAGPGVAPEPTVVGGDPVPDGKYPFQAALLAKSFGDDDFERQFCGGTLISPDHVLTAAHCVEFFGDDPDQLPMRELRVVVGRTVLRHDDGQKRRVVNIDIHPRWDPTTFVFDAAVVTLWAPIEDIDPIMVVSPGTDALQRPGARLTATGWGNTIAQPVGPGPGGTHFPNRLREVRVSLLSQPECVHAYTIEGTNFYNRLTMICAGRTGKDTCQGDSGGPLFVPAATGGWFQVGITSWGFGCAATGFPGVYTKLSNRKIGNFILEAAFGVPV